MGNRQGPYEPDVHRRDDTAGWKVVGKPRNAGAAGRVWQGRAGQADPGWPASADPAPERDYWAAPQPRDGGWRGNPVSPGYGYQGGPDQWSDQQYDQQYDQPTGPYPAQRRQEYATGQFPTPVHPTPDSYPAGDAAGQPYPEQYPQWYEEPVAHRSYWPEPAREWAGAERPLARMRGRPPAPVADENGPLEGPIPVWLSVMAWTAGCFVVPMLLYLLWAWTRSGAIPPECLELTGGPCVSARAKTLTDFINALPGLVGAIALSLLAAVGMRRLSGAWRPATVGVSAAVIGACIATLIASSV